MTILAKKGIKRKSNTTLKKPKKKIRIDDLRVLDAFYEWAWRQGKPKHRRLKSVDAALYKKFLRSTKDNGSRSGFLLSG